MPAEEPAVAPEEASAAPEPPDGAPEAGNPEGQSPEPPVFVIEDDDEDDDAPAEPMMAAFAGGPVPKAAQALHGRFLRLAAHIVETVPLSHERSVALRKLGKARNAALRAVPTA